MLATKPDDEVDGFSLELVCKMSRVFGIGMLAQAVANLFVLQESVERVNEYSLDFTLACHVKSFTDQFLVQHELRKRILRRFGAEGIRIPVQVRGVELRSAADGRG